ncbi:MAG: hypothetical protein DRJ03_06970 [Chloroflexi bacterium]|nr:MAG: hypothetical protein DRJ03_06970 [Chloroflexota bacterium]
MPFTVNEYLKFSSKGWLGLLGSGNRLTAPDNLAWYEERYTIDTIVKPDQIWADFTTIPEAANLAAAQAAAAANPTIIEDLSLAASAIHCTPSLNNKLFMATSTYGDLDTRLKNWLMPQLFPQAGTSLPSIGYMCRVWQGDPNAGGTEITTTAGKVDAATAWFMNFGAGAVLFSSDEALILDPTDIWITGFRYIGATGGSGGGAISVEYNGTPLTANATVLNFINGLDPDGHEGVLAALPGAPAGQVNLYIHPPEFASHFDTTDGSASALVNDHSTAPRYLSAPGTFDITGWAAGTQYPGFHNTTSVVRSTANEFSILNNTSTTLTVTVTSADTTVLATRVLTLVGNNSDTLNNITIDITNWATDSFKFKADCQVTIGIDSLIPQGGKYSVTIEHNDGTDGIFTYAQNDMFYDPNSTAATIADPSIAENTPVLFYLSGIRYYDTGSSFDIGITDIDNINTESYPQPFINFDPSEYGIPAFNLNGGDLTSWTSAWNDINSTYSGTHTITAANYRFIGTDANISGRWVDWVNGGWQVSPNASICIDTWNTQSTALAEYFTDEAQRRTSFDLAGAYNAGAAWDSTQDMGAYDDNTGLLIQSGLIRTRHTDWNSYAPGMAANPDYTGFAGQGTYYRRITDVSAQQRTSCRLTLQGSANLVNEIIADNIEVYIYIPNRFYIRGKVSGAATYNFSTFNTNIVNGSVYSDVLSEPMRTSANNAAGTIDVSFGSYGLQLGGQDFFDVELKWANTSITITSVVVSW